MTRTVTVTFTPEERAAFLARTDRQEHEAIYWPYDGFIHEQFGEWESMWVTDSTEDNEPFINEDDEEEYIMPIAASSYSFELLNDEDVPIFNDCAPIIRQQYDDLEAFKATYPYKVMLDAGPGHHPDSFFIEHVLTQMEWCRDNCPQRYSATDRLANLYPGPWPVLFGFLDKDKAALFKTFFG